MIQLDNTPLWQLLGGRHDWRVFDRATLVTRVEQLSMKRLRRMVPDHAAKLLPSKRAFDRIQHSDNGVLHQIVRLRSIAGQRPRVGKQGREPFDD